MEELVLVIRRTVFSLGCAEFIHMCRRAMDAYFCERGFTIWISMIMVARLASPIRG